MVAMDVFQRITVQETVSNKDHVKYVRKNIELVYMDSNLRKGVKQNSGNGGNKQMTTTYTGVRSDVISMCVVPVQIRHPNFNKVLGTCAMLDNCSQDTFVKEEMTEALGITGAETRVTVKTLNGEISQMTTVVENLKVVGSLGKPKWIKLPRACTEQELPVDEQEIATPKKSEKVELSGKNCKLNLPKY